MLTVSLPIEIIRTRPALVFWIAALSQALLWLLVPTLFYSAPPAGLTEILAVGRDMKFGSELGPPLASWLADIALRATGGHMIGVYLLSQICIVATYWAVFALGRATIGARHAVLAVLLMAGISVFTIGSPDFGPDILMMPLWAFALLHLWRATGENRAVYWFALAIDFALLLLTSHVALLLFAVVVLFVLVSPRARAAAMHVPAAISALIILCMTVPNILLIRDYGLSLTPDPDRLGDAAALDQSLLSWARLIALIAVAHAGAGILIILATNLARSRHSEAATVAGQTVDPYARSFIYAFATAPLILATAFAVVGGHSDFASIPPLLVLSGLAIVTLAGATVTLHHQRVLSIAWISLLIVPPALIAAGVLVLPAVFAVDLRVAQPADDIAKFFAENFERRTQRKLQVVAGDPRLASLVSIASPDRPRVYHDPKSGKPQLASREDAMAKGAVVLWRATDSAGTPPPDIREQFPDIVAEVPRSFGRLIPGRAPALRVGWGVVRPQSASPTSSASPQQ